ncbi:MAG: hypothetical protein NVS2B17_31560 [Candidatus Velthaea sp.]
MPKLVLGYLPIAAALPYYVAVHKGFFKDAGVDVELVRFASTPLITEALLAGRIQATTTGAGALGLALAELAAPGLFKIVAGNISNEKSILDEFIVAKGSPFKKIADLKGKKVACEPGPQAKLEVDTILAKNGCLPETTVVVLPQTQHIAAVVGGQIDAAYTYEPNGTVGKLNGTIEVLEVGVRAKYILGDGTAPWYGGAAVVSSELIKSNPALVKKYVAGMKRGFDVVRKDINAARAVYPSYTAFDVKLAELIPALTYTLFDEFKPADVAAFQKGYDFFYAQKVFARQLKVGPLLYEG